VIATVPPPPSPAATRPSRRGVAALLRDGSDVLPLLGALYGFPVRAVPPATKADDDPTRMQVYRITKTGVQAWSSDGRELAEVTGP
jgi:hypothetical protein